MTEKTIAGKECKFAIHVPAASPDLNDIHIVKEIIYYDDGSSEARLRPHKDFKRPFFITKPNCRNHEEKKEWEDVNNLIKYECTQTDLRTSIARALGKPGSREQIRELCSSPYVYGSDVTASSIIKYQYNKKYPNFIRPYKVAVFDVETDVLFGTESIILATLACGNKVFTVGTKSFFNGINEVEEKVHIALNKYLGEYVQKRNLELEFKIVEDNVEAIKEIFKKAHEWMPDILAIWNVDFDIPKVISELEKANIDPKDVLCDPRIPKQYRLCKYKQGKNKKVTASGKVVPISPANRWHVLELTASFYVLDAMCVYRLIRLAKPEEPSYSLDAILNKELGIRKLSFEQAEGYVKLKWHQFMQTNYKIEYTIYNIFDCVSMLELDEKTKDLSYTLPSFADTTDFSNFNSNPKKIADAMFFYYLFQGKVNGTVGKKRERKEYNIEDIDDTVDSTQEDEDNNTTLSLKDWIVTLPAHLTTADGLQCIEESDIHRTLIRAFCFDSDCSSAYPSATAACNVSKETTLREIINIPSISETTFRLQNIGLLYGPVNAIEYCTTMFGFPTPDKLLEEFNNRQENR